MTALTSVMQRGDGSYWRFASTEDAAACLYIRGVITDAEFAQFSKEPLPTGGIAQRAEIEQRMRRVTYIKDLGWVLQYAARPYDSRPGGGGIKNWCVVDLSHKPGEPPRRQVSPPERESPRVVEGPFDQRDEAEARADALNRGEQG